MAIASNEAIADPAAGDLSAQFDIKQTFEHDSNPLMTSNNRKPITGSVTSPEITIDDDTPDNHLDLGTRVDVNEFDVKGYSSTDTHSSAHFKNTGQTVQAGLGGTIDYDTTRTSEANASGVNIAGIRHLGWSVQPNASFNISAAEQAQITTSYTRSIYADTQHYTDYETYAVTPSYQRSFTPLDSGIIQLQASRYQSTTGQSVTIDNIAPGVGWNKVVSERLSGSANVGIQETRYHFGPGSSQTDSSSFDYNFNFSASYRGQQDTTQFSVSRQLSPNANGSESQSTAFSVGETHNVTEHFETDLVATYQRYDYNGVFTTTGMMSNSVSLAPKFLYHLTETVSVDATYQYRHENITDSRSVQGNMVMLNVVFRPLARYIGW